LRKKKSAYTIPAHSSLISHVRFAPGHGRFLLSTSYDNKAKLWSTRDFQLIKVMEGHEGRVMCGDASEDGKYFATAAMDHTWKLWATS
jgi:U4/U6 small nuclear ribonucleoprotein PRP4